MRDDIIHVGTERLQRVYHDDSVTGVNDHFGSLLFAPDGRPVVDGGKTWLYTGSLVEGKWVSSARPFDLATLQAGPKTRVLSTADGEEWATIHLALKVTQSLYVAFYSTGQMVRAAVCNRPDGSFLPDPTFGIQPTEAWEQGTLEADGGFVPIEGSPGRLRLWLLYDNLGPGTSGQNDWAEVEVDKVKRRVRLLGKHPNNPILLLQPGQLAARTGGNVDLRVRFDDKHLLLYLLKTGRTEYHVAYALSRDPLFQEIDAQGILDEGYLGGETCSEKYQFYQRGDLLTVIYDLGHQDGDWRTGVRRYRFCCQADPAEWLVSRERGAAL